MRDCFESEAARAGPAALSSPSRLVPSAYWGPH